MTTTLKNYLVTIITKKSKIKVNVKANNSKEAKQSVADVLLKCDYFGFKSLDEFKLKCVRTMRRAK